MVSQSIVYLSQLIVDLLHDPRATGMLPELEKCNSSSKISSLQEKLSETEMLKLLESQTQSLDLRRFDHNKDYSEFAFILEFSSVDKLMELKNMLEDRYKNISVSFISND